MDLKMSVLGSPVPVSLSHIHEKPLERMDAISIYRKFPALCLENMRDENCLGYHLYSML